MTTRHKWSKTPNRENVHGSMQDVKRCAACGMKRTRKPLTKTCDIFQRPGEEWHSYRAGFIPDCVPVQEGK